MRQLLLLSFDETHFLFLRFPSVRIGSVDRALQPILKHSTEKDLEMSESQGRIYRWKGSHFNHLFLGLAQMLAWLSCVIGH